MSNGLKILLAVLLAACATVTVSAQFPEYAVGVRAGVSWSNVLFEPTVRQPSMPVTFHAGAQFRMVSEKYFGIVVELNYSQRGFTDKAAGVSRHRRLDYIELPFMSHITFGRKLFRYFINLGPSISYMIADVPVADGAGLPQHTMSVKNRFDYGIVGGMGFEFNTLSGIYTIDARYSFGLGNLFGSRASDHFKTSSNQNITLSLAYLFPLNSRKRTITE